MKVQDMPYKSIDISAVDAEANSIISAVKNAKSTDEILAARKRFLDLSVEIQTALSLCEIRYSCNTADEYYCNERNHNDEISPKIQLLMTEYGNALLESPFRAELESLLSPVYFRHLEVRAKACSPVIVDDMIEENRIMTEYSGLMAEMEFEFRGEKLSRAALAGYFKSDDRETRKEAYTVMGNVLNTYKDKLDDIFDRLVKVRTKMARKLGYDNFIELGYYRMERVCYGKKEIETFRNNVLKSLVPVVSKLRSENAKSIGIDNYMLYDDGVIIEGGNPKPVGDRDYILHAAKMMYHQMSAESGKFIELMFENDALDVDSRKNKWGGGFCTDIPAYKQPFILANFNGTTDDVDVMTHEAGHAFNAYLIADNEFALEIGLGGMETAETHSMSMEFFAWKYMELFFGKNADKYKYMHALDALSFIPYGTIVDYFQHIVYENPDMTPAERNAAWRKLEKQFRPYISTDGMPFLEDGRRWQYQMHIFESPFYYIDYCLAQTAAFGFLLGSVVDYDDAFSRYIRLMKQGGEKYYDELLEEALIPSPFKEGALEALASNIEALLVDIKSKI